MWRAGFQTQSVPQRNDPLQIEKSDKVKALALFIGTIVLAIAVAESVSVDGIDD
mgnify:CR=1 FL=1